MATAATKTMTAEEFFDWVNRPENRDRHYELEDTGFDVLPDFKCRIADFFTVPGEE